MAVKTTPKKSAKPKAKTPSSTPARKPAKTPTSTPAKKSAKTPVATPVSAVTPNTEKTTEKIVQTPSKANTNPPKSTETETIIQEIKEESKQENGNSTTPVKPTSNGTDQPESATKDDSSTPKKPRAKRVNHVPPPKFHKVESQYPPKVVWAKLAVRDFVIRCKLPQNFSLYHC